MKSIIRLIFSLALLSLVWQISAQTKINYHERFFDKRMKWSEFEYESKGVAELLPLENRMYYIESLNDELIIAEYLIKLDTGYDFSYSFNYINPENAYIGISSGLVKLNFELNLLEGKYRISYTQKGKYRTGKWKKLEKQIIDTPEKFYSIKIVKDKNNYHFFCNNFPVTILTENKFDSPAIYNRLEIGTTSVVEVSDVLINGFVYLSKEQKFMSGEGISQDELATQKFYSLSEIEKMDEYDSFLNIYKIKIDNYDFAWDKKELPKNIFNCINLQQVEISARDKGNYAQIIEQLQNFQSLQVLELLIDSVPETIGKLRNLRKLSAGNWTPISITALEQICNLEKLVYLDLGTDEPYGYIPEEGIINIGNLTKLEYLDLSFTGLGSVPAGIFNLTNLKILDIGGNDLLDLPNDFLKLKKLETLYLNDNFQGEIPTVIFSLNKLKYLDLSLNKLNSLPEEMFNLKNLEILVLYGNNFSEKEIDKIKNGFTNLIQIE
ncbi:MAG: leucine-rich repeat domain-containing protein [Bacteroidales bacterium]|nr:leucine-rich repeat domain-containing protein [Bacteroidales bacterium]